MNKNKTLKELGDEYLTYIKINEENISKCREKLKSALAKGDEALAAELRKTITVLYKISYELKENQSRLVNYYGEKTSCGILCKGNRKE